MLLPEDSFFSSEERFSGGSCLTVNFPNFEKRFEPNSHHFISGRKLWPYRKIKRKIGTTGTRGTFVRCIFTTLRLRCLQEAWIASWVMKIFAAIILFCAVTSSYSRLMQEHSRNDYWLSIVRFEECH